jgi:hypothetical protein
LPSTSIASIAIVVLGPANAPENSPGAFSKIVKVGVDLPLGPSTVNSHAPLIGVAACRLMLKVKKNRVANMEDIKYCTVLFLD